MAIEGLLVLGKFLKPRDSVHEMGGVIAKLLVALLSIRGRISSSSELSLMMLITNYLLQHLKLASEVEFVSRSCKDG